MFGVAVAGGGSGEWSGVFSSGAGDFLSVFCEVGVGRDSDERSGMLSSEAGVTLPAFFEVEAESDSDALSDEVTGGTKQHKILSPRHHWALK